MPRAMARAGVPKVAGVPATSIVPLSNLSVPNRRLQEFGALGADESRDAQDLPGVKVEADIPVHTMLCEVLDAEANLACSPGMAFLR